MKLNRVIGTGMVATAIVFSLPLVVAAQSQGLTQAIRAEIMQDPRSAQIPQAQLDAMVASLAQSAAQQGVSENDITWKPVSAAAGASQQGECDFLCSINQIFGFGGTDYTIPFGLGLTSALLILFISLMLHRHHKHGIDPTVEAIHTHS